MNENEGHLKKVVKIMKESIPTSFHFCNKTSVLAMLYLPVSSLIQSIACKSFGGVQKQQSCFWRSFTSGSRSEMPRNKCPFFYLFWTTCPALAGAKKIKKKNTNQSSLNNHYRLKQLTS